MSDTPAGWYQAEDRPGQQRYHDGTGWTDNYAPIDQPTQQAYPVQQKKSGGAKKVLIPLGACLALLILAGIIGAVAGGGDDEEASTDDRTSAPSTNEPDGTAATTAADEPETTAAPEPETTAAPVPTEPEREQFEGQDVYVLGETATSGDFDITLNTVEDPFVPSNSFEMPEAGQRLVGVELTLVNNTDAAVPFSSLLAGQMIDDQGQARDPAFVGLDRPQLDGDIPPGATRRGWIVFSVGADAAGLKLRIKGNLTATGSVFAIG